MDTNTDMQNSIELANMNYYKSKYDEALTRSIQNKIKIRANKIKMEKRRKAVRNAAIALTITVGVVVGGPIVNRQHLINKAIEYEKQEISLMMDQGNIKYTEDQMLGLMDMFGNEKGVEMATGMQWDEYCRSNGYTEISYISDNGTYVTRAPSMKVLKNYLEAAAIERMQQNTDENGNFVFPDLQDNEEKSSDGGKLI